MLQTAGWYLGVAFIVMQVVEVVLPFARLPEAAGTAILVLLTIGFPIALGLSWAFDVTPPAFRREARSGPSPAAMEEPRPLRSDSVVVLPFSNLSDDPENAYFSDGITDDIITSIAHVDGLRVLSRASSMRYRDTKEGLAEIAGRLGVATVVTGSVRRMGSKVRIVVEVIDARRDDHLWADTYDRELEDIFHVQSEIAAEVARAVERKLSTADRNRIRARGTSDGEAYDLYLRGRFLWNQRSESSLTESLRFFRLALERDRRFALAHSGLADAYAILGIYGMLAPREAFEEARRAATAALEIEPGLGEAIAVRACSDAVYGWSWEDAERGFLEAVDETPSYATAYQWYATNLLLPLRRFDEARERLDQAAELDPLSGAIAVSRAIVHYYAGEIDRACAALEQLVEMHPGFSLLYYFLGQSYERRGSFDRAMEALRRAVVLSEESSEALSALAHAAAVAGHKEEAIDLVEQLRERSERTYVSPLLVAQPLIALDDVDSAFELLGSAMGLRAADLIWLAVRPSYDPLRTDRRFIRIVDEVGLPRAPRSDS